MNEVLPSPDRAPSASQVPSPRARTLAHMHKLLAVAAATSAMACSKEGSNDTIKADDHSKDKTTIDPTATTAATTTATATDTVSTAPTVTATAPTPGYVVVDPMPPPAKCAGAASTITTTAAWKTSSAGALAIEVHLRKSSKPDVLYSHKTPPTAYSATILATSFSGSEVVITVLPDKSATYASLSVPLDCSAGSEHLNVELDLSSLAGGAPPTSGTPVKVTLYDSY